MGGSVFFFIESKSFEFSTGEGGTYYLLRNFERGYDSLHSIFLGKTCAKRLLLNIEELISLKSDGTFVRSIRENDKAFIVHTTTGFQRPWFFLTDFRIVKWMEEGIHHCAGR